MRLRSSLHTVGWSVRGIVQCLCQLLLFMLSIKSNKNILVAFRSYCPHFSNVYLLYKLSVIKNVYKRQPQVLSRPAALLLISLLLPQLDLRLHSPFSCYTFLYFSVRAIRKISMKRFVNLHTILMTILYRNTFLMLS